MEKCLQSVIYLFYFQCMVFCLLQFTPRFLNGHETTNSQTNTTPPAKDSFKVILIKQRQEIPQFVVTDTVTGKMKFSDVITFHQLIGKQTKS